MRQIYAYETEEERLAIQPIADELVRQAEVYKADFLSDFALKEPASFVVWTKALFANQIFGHHELPAYNNGMRIVMCPDKKEWENLLTTAFAPYNMPRHLVAHYRSLPDYQMKQIFLHEITHDSDLFESDYGVTRDDVWFEEGMCEYLSYRYLLKDKEFTNLRSLLQEQVDFFGEIFGKFHVEQFSEETYQKGNLAYLYTFYLHAFLTVSQLVEEFGSVEQVFAIYQAWWQDSRNRTLFDYFKERGNQ